MLISADPTDSYDVLPGRYQAVCIDSREIAKGSRSFLRLVWALNESANPNVRYLVGKNYEPSLRKGSELRNDIDSWLGDQIDVRSFDTDTLKGRTADVTVKHIHNEGHPKPFCWVSEINPTTHHE
jgi:hypothetical protein